MIVRRRDFIKTAGGFALATVARSLPAWAQASPESSSAAAPIRVAVLSEPGFPSRGISLDPATLQEALKGMTAEFIGVEALQTRLHPSTFDLFLNPYGSAFPKSAFHAISKFLMDGGSLVNVGGVPFSVPVNKSSVDWIPEIPQVAYHRRFGITQASPVKTTDSITYQANPATDWAGSLADEFKAEVVHELYVRFTSIKDFPAEDGSAGPRDAIISPLLIGANENNERIVAPFVIVERFQGDYSGGCWVLANFDGTITSKGIRLLVLRAAQGAMQLTARPSFASFFPGELPSITVQFRQPDGKVETLIDGDCRIEILDDKGHSLKRLSVPLHGSGTIATGSANGVNIEHFKPGLHEVRATLRLHADLSPVISHRTGFWVFDESLLEGGKDFSTEGTYLVRGNEPYPVTGTTYMASDAHRKFLFEPNPYVWNKDFSEMKAAGINMVRTGIWTGWKHYMFDVGAPSEEPLRAMDAFVMTARKYNIPIIFTFFAFLPETWGGANPYLDPRAINAQKEFVTAFVRRYRHAKEIIWDLINEPSFCNPQYLWQCRPNYDRYEAEAWDQWLKNRYPSPTNDAWTAEMQERFRQASDEPIALPSKDDFDDVNLFGDRRPAKVIDYRLFAQDMFARWVKEMREAIAAAVGAEASGMPRQLVTVGQDEGGTYEAPGNQFFADAVDFTCVHNWWLNDDLLWDQVVTAFPGKPNLVEETGVMSYENMDGQPWRSEAEVSNLLERKIAVAIGSGSAGFIEWLWSTNPYMTLDNESGIGLNRVDGTTKPELAPLRNVARFVAAHRSLMRGRKDPDVVMIIPHSQMFSTRNFSTDATRRCVRSMSYDLNTPLAAVSEYRIGSVGRIPKLIVLPSSRAITQECWESILGLVVRGSTLLVSGTIDRNEHWLPVQRTIVPGSRAESYPITQEEFISINGTEVRLHYRGDKIQRLEKAVVAIGQPTAVMTTPKGKGKIVWSPLPIELADNVEPTTALYSYALAQAGITPTLNVEPANSGVLVLPCAFENAILFTCVSGCDKDTELHITLSSPESQLAVTVPAQRSAMIFIDSKTGRVLGQA